MAPPKAIKDLPHFSISSIERGETHRATGRETFRIQGKFDHTTGVREGRCWLLLPDRDWLVGDLESFNSESGTAIFIDYEEPRQDLIGMSLPYVDGRWQAYHVWMVTDPSCSWNRLQLQAGKVIADIVHSKEPQTSEKQPVQIWIRVKASGEEEGKERWYPALDEEDARRKVAEIRDAGWEHEHCELCWNSINVGTFGFNDGEGHWVCESCYEKFVAAHDLSFLFPEKG